MRDANLLECILDRAEDATNLSLALLKDITNDFSDERKIGQGGFGEVYKGVLGDRIVAVKRIYINIHTFDDKLFRREVTSLMKINHRNVVRFLGVCSEGYQKPIEDNGSGKLIWANVLERLLCFEYISNGSLDKHITDELRGLGWETRYEIIIGICKGLHYLHMERQIIHMDLKPENILLDHQDGKYMVPKITDFGLSRPNKNSCTVGQCFGTLEYLAPEYREESKTTSACDIYSLGLIIIELVTGCKDIPYENNVLRRWRHRWKKAPTQLQYQQVTRCIYIAKRCREQKPDARPSISKIISFLSESKSTYGKISPCFNEDDMLGIKPLQLRLSSELTNEISCSVELTNDTLNSIAFNIQPPSTKYIAQPVQGIVQPKSKCDVKITVQPRDSDHADKFIVQSMQVEESAGLREEDITERMSHEEARKVVDEVDLMVVYEPQENSKGREDTNIPAEEVRQAKPRKIVESAYGKGNVRNSENAEGNSMDINSSAQGQCAEQTEQCKLHSLQSFSRHYPTNMKYLGKESDRAVDLARGAMGSLLDKLGKLVTEDYNLERSTKSDIKSFSEDLRNMHRDLPKLENVNEAKIWVEEVRELSYHIEDMVDNFLVHVEADSSRSGFRELRHKGIKLLVNGMPTHDQIDDVIGDIKNQVQAVADRKEKFDVNNVVAYATAEAYIDDLRNLVIYEDTEELIGIEASINELIRLIEEDGDASEQNLKIVSIVGLGGLGKTTLAKAVYDKFQAQYHTRAFVSVGRNPDVKEVLENIISELQRDFNPENLNVRQLIKKLNEMLQNKRYFIVIDDLWDSEASLPTQKTEAWSIIKYAFPRNKHGSRVITTTRNQDVALACCNAESKYVYRIKPLSAKESRRLFLRRTFGSENVCPDTVPKEKNSVDILKICGGMPLAINSIASLLAGKPETTWEYVRKSLGALTEVNGALTEGNGALENMKQILDLSYIHLPDHLKTCLLHVCMYPEDREIGKSDLLRQWIAEGFVHVDTNSRLDAEDVAEIYFKTLMNMCMIQPGKIDYNDEVLSCRVHDIILDLMRSKSSDVNFMHVIDGSKDETGARGKIRRVSVHSNDEKDMRIFSAMKNKDPLKHVRSVILYRRTLVPYFLEFNNVRVLHLEYKGFSCSVLDLTGISRLFHLRYLKIASFGRTYGDLKLPNEIGELQKLETIDLQGGVLRNFPSGIVSLPRLSHLRYSAAVGLALPRGIGRLTSLRTLGGVSVSLSSVDSINGLGELTNLRNLEIHSTFYLRRAGYIEARMEALQSSLSRLHTSLRVFTMRTNTFQKLNLSHWNRKLFPQGSHIRKLDLRGRNFHRCPKWIGQLHDLYSFRIQVQVVAYSLSIVAGLPSLAYFSIFSDELVKGNEKNALFPGSGSFPALKHLRFRCPTASLTFQKGALPKLEKLEILFGPHMTGRFLPVGIEHLPVGTLKEISLSVAEKLNHKEMSDELGLDQSTDKLIKHKRKLRTLLKRAFKVHHPGADIVVCFEDGDLDDEEYYSVEDAQGVDNEEDYEEESDEEDDIVEYAQGFDDEEDHEKESDEEDDNVEDAQGFDDEEDYEEESDEEEDIYECVQGFVDEEDHEKESDEEEDIYECVHGFVDEEDHEKESDEEDDNVEDAQGFDDEEDYEEESNEEDHNVEDAQGLDDEEDYEEDSDEEDHNRNVEDWMRRIAELKMMRSELKMMRSERISNFNTRLPRLLEEPTCSSLDRAEPVASLPVDINDDLLVQRCNSCMLDNGVGDISQAPLGGHVGIHASATNTQPQAEAVDDDPSQHAFWDSLVIDSCEGVEDNHNDPCHDAFWDNLLTDEEGEADVGQA